MSQEIVIGDKVSVRKAKDVPLSFKGTVEKLYANAAMLTVFRLMMPHWLKI